MDLNTLVEDAIKEDFPSGDLTTESLSLPPRFGEAHLVAKEDLILSGILPVEMIVKRIDSKATIRWNFSEGDFIYNRQVIAVISGNLLQILRAERVALNFLGHLSGIATLTGCYAKQVAHTKTKILDTRKTLPGYRQLQKQAVVHGGGYNHRMNLSDAILLKENHIQVAGGITAAVERIRTQTKTDIEVETRNLTEVREAVSLKVKRIMLDNMDNETMKQALELIPPAIETEASGNMNLQRVRSVAELGVNFISVGALTHSAPCADISLLFDWENEH